MELTVSLRQNGVPDEVCRRLPPAWLGGGLLRVSWQHEIHGRETI